MLLLCEGVSTVNNKPFLSIIVPVYNVEQYLPKCLDSILAQTFTDFEVIAVDDGSPDNCGQILNEYAQKDKRIKIIHKENGGVSSARNTALDVAQGEYIGFVDPDDYITVDMYEHLCTEAKSGDFDIVQCGCTKINSASEVVLNLACDENREYTNTNDILCDFFNCIIINSVCNKIFRREVVQDTRFKSDLRVAEDGLFVHDCLLKARRLRVTKKSCYCYLMSETSVIHSGISEKVFDNFVALDILSELYTDNKQVFNSFKIYSAWLILGILPGILASGIHDERIPKIIKKLVETKDVVLKGNFSKKEKIFTLMLWIAPKLTCRLILLYLKNREIY